MATQTQLPPSSAGTAAGGRAAADTLAHALQLAHEEKLRLCDMLEEIADALPGRIDRFRCLTAANALAPLVRSVHRFEEDIVFPAYRARCADPEVAAILDRLRAEHLADECFADEVTEVLLSLGHGAPADNAEAIGFMLRGFFETVRRHVGFERGLIQPAIRPSDDKCAHIRSTA